MWVASNPRRVVLSNGIDWVTVFLDGRVKVASRSHLWDVVDSGRHTAMGQYVTLGVGRDLGLAPGSGAPTVPAFETRLDQELGDTLAATVAATNGTFVEFVHDGSIRVGNDDRDIAETFNTGRESLEGGPSGRGGAVMITFMGTYRSARVREHDFLVDIPDKERPAANRLLPGEFVIKEGKIAAPRTTPASW